VVTADETAELPAVLGAAVELVDTMLSIISAEAARGLAASAADAAGGGLPYSAAISSGSGDARGEGAGGIVNTVPRIGELPREFGSELMGASSVAYPTPWWLVV